MKYEHRYLFVEILEGVLLVMLGVATMLRTEQVLDSLTLIFGILAVITGLADVMFYIRLERHTGFRPAVSLVSSILSIMLGCALIAHPNVGTGIMLIIFPIFIIAHCIARLTHLNIVRYVAGEVSFWLTLISNAVGLILGVILLFDPALSAATLGNGCLLYFGGNCYFTVRRRVSAWAAYTVWPGSTDSVSHTLPPITQLSPITVFPPSIVAPE